MILLNFSHPISAEQRAKIERLAGQPIDQLVDIPVQFDNDAPFSDQILDLSARIPLDSVALQTEPILTTRSEERRVGKECRSRWSPYH